MDVREKLVELLCKSGSMKCDSPTGECTNCLKLADHLIANGVTVQEWISVKDRLPETEDVFLCWSKDLADMMFCYTSDFMQLEVTHWMPLPEPPKGE